MLNLQKAYVLNYNFFQIQARMPAPENSANYFHITRICMTKSHYGTSSQLFICVRSIVLQSPKYNSYSNQ